MRISIIVATIFICSLVSCRKFVDVGPPTTNLVAQTVFRNEATATAAMLAVYASMESDGWSYNAIYQSGLSADEMINYDLGNYQTDLATNNLTADNPIIEGTWLRMYKYIYQANAVLAGLEKSTGIRDQIKEQLTGEAKFVRAFCHFYLTSLFGAVPIATTPDYRLNIKLKRQPTSDVYALIDEDLREAVRLLNEDYLNGNNVAGTERVRPNRSAAKALLARLKLYEKKWQEAEMWAGEVIGNAHYDLLPDLNSVFLKNSKEAIWQWQNVIPGYNTYAAVQLILLSTPSVVSLDTHFVKQFSVDDKRRTNWIDTLVSGNAYYLYPVKYKVGYNSPTVTEYSMVLRLSEQYLIRAEALAQQGKLLEAEADLNTIRNRAGLTSLANLSRQEILDSLQQERRFELFAEFGDRWLELKRSGSATQVLSVIKGSNWVQTDSLYPIPLAELQKNPLLTQNDGY